MGGVASVATVLFPHERARVEAAGEGVYRAVHRNSVAEVLHDLRERDVDAVLVSVSRCTYQQDAEHLRTLVREFPRVPAVALLTQLEAGTPHAVLSLGRCGVRSLIDVRQPRGWQDLRNALASDRRRDIEHLALAQLSLDLAGAPEDCYRFFESLFINPASLATVRQLAVLLHVKASTLMSRFFRARLPAPKRYLAIARLTRAAWLFENSGLSVANVANHLEYSSPQSFGRHVRTMLGMTALEFRQRYDGEGMLLRFRDELIVPYLTTLRSFNPLDSAPRWDAGQPRSRSESNASSRELAS